MNNENGKERLSSLLAEENDRTVRSTLDGCDTDFIPSKRFTKRMDRIIKNLRSGKSLDYTPPTRRYVTLAAVSVLLLLTIILAASTNALSYVGNAIRNEFEAIFGNNEETTDQPKIDTEYLPDFVPMGFDRSESTILPTIIRYAWINEKDESLVFIQYLESEKNIFEEDNLIFSEIETKTAKVTVARNETIIHYVWSAHGYSFKISAYPSLSGNLIIRMIDSLSEKN